MSAMVQIFLSFTKWKYFFFHCTNENIHYLFYITCTKIQILKQIEKKKHWKTILAQAKHFTSRAFNPTREVLRGRLRHAIRTHTSFARILSYYPRLTANIRRLYRNVINMYINVNDECNKHPLRYNCACAKIRAECKIGDNKPSTFRQASAPNSSWRFFNLQFCTPPWSSRMHNTI